MAPPHLWSIFKLFLHNLLSGSLLCRRCLSWCCLFCRSLLCWCCLFSRSLLCWCCLLCRSLLCWCCLLCRSLLSNWLCNNLDNNLWNNLYRWLRSSFKFASSSDDLLQGLSGQEANLLAGLDLNCLAGKWVTTLTSRTINLLELTKIINHDIVALGNIANDCVENYINSASCLFLAIPKLWSQVCDELGLVH